MLQLVPGEDRVCVSVNEAGQQRAAVQVDDLGAARRGGRAHFGDLPGPDPDAGARREEALAVEHSAAGEQDFVAGSHMGLPGTEYGD